MTKSTEVGKKKPGRPATGNDPLISARVPPEIVAAIDAWADKNSATRSEAIRRLVELGLKKGK
jgi:Ribbon-helix-helix protein, copG family